MRLQQIVGKSSIPQLLRDRIEMRYFHSSSTAVQAVQQAFPHHVVDALPGKISVGVKDRSFAIAVFKEVF